MYSSTAMPVILDGQQHAIIHILPRGKSNGLTETPLLFLLPYIQYRGSMTFYFLVQKIKVLFIVPKSPEKPVTFAAKLNLNTNHMRHEFSFETLLQTPVCMMTGEQLAFLVTNLPLLNKQGDNASSDTELPKPRRLVYGIKGIADTFGCSIPTANRIKKSSVIDDAITQVGRKIVVDAGLALELAASAKKKGKEVAS